MPRERISSPSGPLGIFLHRIMCDDLRTKTKLCRGVVKGEGWNRKGKVDLGL